MVDRFQSGATPVLVLSLKAAGTGLNLTRAGHVVHFDRWWNPAVEEQATDRAYRIGQTQPGPGPPPHHRGHGRGPHRRMLQSKRALADAVLGSGEAALTELTVRELSDLVSLRRPSRDPPARRRGPPRPARGTRARRGGGADPTVEAEAEAEAGADAPEREPAPAQAQGHDQYQHQDPDRGRNRDRKPEERTERSRPRTSHARRCAVRGPHGRKGRTTEQAARRGETNRPEDLTRSAGRPIVSDGTTVATPVDHSDDAAAAASASDPTSLPGEATADAAPRHAQAPRARATAGRRMWRVRRCGRLAGRRRRDTAAKGRRARGGCPTRPVVRRGRRFAHRRRPRTGRTRDFAADAFRLPGGGPRRGCPDPGRARLRLHFHAVSRRAFRVAAEGPTPAAGEPWLPALPSTSSYEPPPPTPAGATATRACPGGAGPSSTPGSARPDVPPPPATQTSSPPPATQTSLPTARDPSHPPLDGRAGRDGELRRTFPALPPRATADGSLAGTWWGNAWVTALEEGALDAARLARGRGYAERGTRRRHHRDARPGPRLRAGQPAPAVPRADAAARSTTPARSGSWTRPSSVPTRRAPRQELPPPSPTAVSPCSPAPATSPAVQLPRLRAPLQARRCPLLPEQHVCSTPTPSSCSCCAAGANAELLDALSRLNAARAARRPGSRTGAPARRPGRRARTARALPPLRRRCPRLRTPNSPRPTRRHRAARPFALDQLATDAAARAHALLITGRDPVGGLTRCDRTPCASPLPPFRHHRPAPRRSTRPSRRPRAATRRTWRAPWPPGARADRRDSTSWRSPGTRRPAASTEPARYCSPPTSPPSAPGATASPTPRPRPAQGRPGRALVRLRVRNPAATTGGRAHPRPRPDRRPDGPGRPRRRL